ncbi:MAG: hypothetical protein APR56_03810 [Methanosaeta sp. SDB]|nr:MAG: hypothetical protein APR56_03810 [Methanosaeta sp. SDB]
MKDGKVVFVIGSTYELSRRFVDSGIDANVLHPGVVRTKLLRAGFGDYPGDDPRRVQRPRSVLQLRRSLRGKAACTSRG